MSSAVVGWGTARTYSTTRAPDKASPAATQGSIWHSSSFFHPLTPTLGSSYLSILSYHHYMTLKAEIMSTSPSPWGTMGALAFSDASS